MKKAFLIASFSSMLIAGSNTAFAGGGSFLDDMEKGGGSGKPKAGGFFADDSGSGATLSSFYGGASIGQTYKDNCREIDYSGNFYDAECDSVEGDTAWKVFGGYKFLPNIGVEVSYIDFGTYGNKTTVGYSYTETHGEAKGINAAVMASASVAEQLEVFSKIGVLHWEREGWFTTDSLTTPGAINHDKGTDLSLAGGATFKFNDNIGLRGEVEHFDDIDVNLVSIGGTFSTY